MLRDAAIDGLLILGVVTVALSCIGVLVMRTPLQRLHYLGPLSMVAPMLIAGAVAAGRNSYHGAAAKAIFIALLIVAFAPVLSHQMARMADARREPS